MEKEVRTMNQKQDKGNQPHLQSITINPRVISSKKNHSFSSSNKMGKDSKDGTSLEVASS